MKLQLLEVQHRMIVGRKDVCLFCFDDEQHEPIYNSRGMYVRCCMEYESIDGSDKIRDSTVPNSPLSCNAYDCTSTKCSIRKTVVDVNKQ